MGNRRSCWANAFAVVFVAYACAPANAAGTLIRTFVSSAGSDNNPCTVSAPCATFATAYRVVMANGIVAALDPGKYGPLTITGPITVDGHGFAAITAPATESGITVNAGPTDKVILNGLVLDSGGQAGMFGITFNSGGSLTVNGCVVRNMGETGLSFFFPGAPSMLVISNSVFEHNGAGVSIEGTTTASIDRTAIVGNVFDGLSLLATANSNLTVAVTDSVSAHNGRNGFDVESITPTSNASLTLTRVLAAGNEIGISVNNSGQTATVWLAQSTITGNGNSFLVSADSTIETFGDNYFAANGNSNGNLTPANKR